ncbi:rubredoxin [Azospirillum brasilense]|uniref:Rubredoxin n=1 Tax=Azospirillum brasilense TaxID=192 RepID=A0A560B696_AZOBR|nr:rubredoxin [Azospirillum brasilense]
MPTLPHSLPRHAPRRGALRLIAAVILALFVRPTRAEDPRLSEIWRCGGGDCPGYEYHPRDGDPEHGAPAGTAFQNLPADWFCPRCGAGKPDFRRMGE